MGMWHPNKPEKHPNLAVGVALCQDAYNEIGLEAPNTAMEQHTAMVIAMLDTGASICLVGRCMTIRLGMTRSNKKQSHHRSCRYKEGPPEHPTHHAPQPPRLGNYQGGANKDHNAPTLNPVSHGLS